MTKLFVEQVGQGPDLVLLHGWGIHSGIWSRLSNVLQHHYRITVIDLPGHGRSALINEPYDVANVVEQLITVAPAQAHWLGWSLGGLLAVAVAHYYPERVNRLITVASNPKFVATPNWPGMREEVLTKFAHRLTRQYQTTLHEFLLLQLMHEPQRKALYEQLKAELQLDQQAPEGLWPALQLLGNGDLRSKLAAISCPSYHIYGAQDAIVPAALASAINQLAPNHQTSIIPGASHMPFLSEQQQFIHLLQRFLDS